ncbi:hypothetical protein RUM43_002110 [Polyplax serrata]|uniref:Uncharacterized protein n=1 Tax=Polyplax serrata TaxID=468196 RepID=A0AAN8RVP5_POLSC
MSEKGCKIVSKAEEGGGGKSVVCGGGAGNATGNSNVKTESRKERVVLCETGAKTPVVSALIGDTRPRKISVNLGETPIVSALENPPKTSRFARKSGKFSGDSRTGQSWQSKPGNHVNQSNATYPASTPNCVNRNNFKNANYYEYPQMTRIFPSQKFRSRIQVRRETSEDETGSRCSTPSSTTSTLSNGTTDTDLDERDLMPHCMIVAEGGEGLPLMQVRKPSMLSCYLDGYLTV